MKICTLAILPIALLVACTVPYLKGIGDGVYRMLGTEITKTANKPPITILEFGSSETNSRYRSFSEWRNEMKLQNTSHMTIIRYDVSLKLYDVYGKVIKSLSGYSVTPLKPNESTVSHWSETIYQEGRGHRVTGYVAKVAFENGTIWEAKMN